MASASQKFFDKVKGLKPEVAKKALGTILKSTTLWSWINTGIHIVRAVSFGILLIVIWNEIFNSTYGTEFYMTWGFAYAFTYAIAVSGSLQGAKGKVVYYGFLIAAVALNALALGFDLIYLIKWAISAFQCIGTLLAPPSPPFPASSWIPGFNSVGLCLVSPLRAAIVIIITLWISALDIFAIITGILLFGKKRQIDSSKVRILTTDLIKTEDQALSEKIGCGQCKGRVHHSDITFKGKHLNTLAQKHAYIKSICHERGINLYDIIMPDAHWINRNGYHPIGANKDEPVEIPEDLENQIKLSEIETVNE